MAVGCWCHGVCEASAQVHDRPRSHCGGGSTTPVLTASQPLLLVHFPIPASGCSTCATTCALRSSATACRWAHLPLSSHPQCQLQLQQLCGALAGGPACSAGHPSLTLRAHTHPRWRATPPSFLVQFPTVVAWSEVIRVEQPNEPMQGHLSLTGLPG